MFALVTGLASWVANRTLSVYHDGLRPIVPSLRAGEMSRAELAKKAISISLGFILFYALPFSLASGVMVSHTIFLVADVVGLAIPSPALAFALGAVYGAAASLGLDLLVAFLSQLPHSFVPELALIAKPVVYTYVGIPAVAATYQFGAKYGLTVLVISLLARYVSALVLGPSFASDASAFATLAAASSLIGFVAGAAGLVVRSLAGARRTIDESITKSFRENVRQLRRGLIPLGAIGALAAMLARGGWLAGEPLTTVLLGQREVAAASAVAIMSALGFMPMVVMSALVTGVYTTQGYCDWILGAGYLAPNLLVAGLIGAALMCVEILAIAAFLKFITKYPKVRETGAAIRDALTVVAEVSFLVGGAISAEAIWPGTGFLITSVLYVANEVAGCPVMRLAVGPLCAMLVGILLNILSVVQG